MFQQVGGVVFGELAYTAFCPSALNPKKHPVLPVTGWYELLRELEIQHALGRL